LSEVGTVLHDIRMASDLSCVDLAKQLECTAERIIEFETRSALPSFNLFVSVCLICNADIIEALQKVDANDIVAMAKNSKNEYKVVSNLKYFIKALSMFERLKLLQTIKERRDTDG